MQVMASDHGLDRAFSIHLFTGSGKSQSVVTVHFNASVYASHGFVIPPGNLQKSGSDL